MQDAYADVNISHVDAKVAAAMCRGGAITYQVNPLSGISAEWILQHVVPNMVRYGIHPQVCIVLGTAVLWALFDTVQRERFPDGLRQDVMRAYEGLGDRNQLAVGENPVLVSDAC
jgi:hypothetical protein